VGSLAYREAMPTVDADGLAGHYETAGSGETVAFLGDAGLGPWQWGALFEGIAGPRRALVWDLPGTGRSDPPGGPLDVDRLVSVLESVLAHAGADRAHLVGAGLGGMVALRYARRFGRARSLALLGTAAHGGRVNEEALRALHPDSRTAEALRDSLSGAFTPAYGAQTDAIDAVVNWRRDEDATGDALAAQLDCLLAFDAGPLYERSVPALVCHGVDDPVIPTAAGESLAEGLPNARFVPIAGRHLAYFESGPAVADRLDGFLDRVG
jgi:pimeloyl-ACP methyl ester carboxylesterase